MKVGVNCDLVNANLDVLMSSEKMQLKDIVLPSNKKFGLFFASIFIGVATLFFYHGDFFIASICIVVGFLFLMLSVLYSDLLLPLNKLWMRFGLVLGTVMTPVILGLLYFGIFTPIALFMRIVGRDELRLKLSRYSSNWTDRQPGELSPDSFKNQF